MKKRFLLIACALGFFFIVKAQDTRSLYQQSTDSFFQYLDKSVIPTGILYDRVAQWADLDTLSGLITNNTPPSVTTSSNHFLQAWQELYDASYNQSNLMKPEWLDAFITQNRDANVVPVGVLNYQFNVLDSEAVQKNLVYLGSDSMLHDVAGRSQNPYYTRTIFLASPLLEQVQPGSVTFQFPSHMLLQNNPVTVNSLFIDFGEGYTATLTPGNSVTVPMLQTGSRTLILTANFSNGSQKVIRAVLEVNAPGGETYSAMGTSRLQTELHGPRVDPCTIKYMQADISFADYQTGVNKKAEINVGYYFANCSVQQLHKPIIILDGFDPGDTRDIFQIYDLLYYNNGTANFGNEMRQAGYDVIVVNFPNIIEGFVYGFIPVYRDGGADYIERNAMAVVKLIDSVNQVLQSNGSSEKIVLVGPSMGGLISRYALAYMEKIGMNHNCRLWISFDTPHLGANISIGDQWWLEYYARVAGNEGAKKSLNKQIGSVAAQQMLIHHWRSNSVAPAPAPDYRPQFLQNLQTNNGKPGSNGFPIDIGLRRVAVTNGSGNGTVQPEGSACGKAVQLDAYIRQWVMIRFFPASALARQHISSSNVYFTPNYGNTCKVFDGWYQVGRWGRNRYEERYAQTPSYTAGLDILPGGKFNTQEVIKKQGEKSSAFGSTLHVQKFTNVINNHAFIPTVSALALTNPTSRNWAENLSTRNLVCTGETPFDDYFTPTSNEDHVFLSSANVAWIKNQINNQPPLPPYTIQIVSGYEPICANATTYQVTNLPPGAIVTWSTSSNSISFSPVTGLQTTVTRTSNGSAILNATISSCLGTTTISKSIRVGGYSSSDYPVSGPSSASCGQYLYFSTNDLPGATNYQWFWPSDWTYAGGQGTRYLAVQTPSYTASSGAVGVRVASACDAGGSLAMIFVSVNCYGYYAYSLSPNPATNEVTVAPATTIENKSAAQATITEVNIYDQSGTLKKQQKFGKVKKATLNVSNLPYGVYIIEIVNGSYKERQQLSIVKH